MREKTLKTVLAFNSTADAIKTEAVMAEAGIKGRFIPLPVEIAASCGLAWLMSPEDYNNLPAEVKNKLPEEYIVREIMFK